MTNPLQEGPSSQESTPVVVMPEHPTPDAHVPGAYVISALALGTLATVVTAPMRPRPWLGALAPVVLEPSPPSWLLLSNMAFKG